MPIVWQHSNRDTGTSRNFDCGVAGNHRLIPVILAYEGEPGAGFQGTISVDGKTFTQALVIQENNGPGLHLELHTIDEEALGVTAGINNISYSDGDADWGIHLNLYHGVANDTLRDSYIDSVVASATISALNITTDDDDMVFLSACHGSSTASYTGFTSPLTKRTNEGILGPDGAALTTASGIETTGQTDKTYTATSDSASARQVLVCAVFAPYVAPVGLLERSYPRGVQRGVCRGMI